MHDRITARLARFIDANGPRVLAAAPRWKVPTLLMYAGADKLVAPVGSSSFASTAPANLLTSKCFQHMYHEIFNEADPSQVYAALQGWLDRQAPVA